MTVTTSSFGKTIKSWLLVSPLAAILGLFLLMPVVVIVMVSFWGSSEFSYYPAFQFDNYAFLFTSSVTWSVYLKTLTFTLITWSLCLMIGFTVAYFWLFMCKA